MSVDSLTNHSLTESDGSRANDLYTPEALGSVSQMVKNGNKLVFDQDSSGKDTFYIQNKRTIEKKGCDRKTVCTSWT